VQKGTTIVEYNEKQYGFCCPGCDTKFVKDPEKYSKHLSKDGKKK
jgi:YHS domain-containing protein